jgi:anti-anti-sigma factor
MGIGLKIELEEIEDKVILRIEGRIDAASAPTLDRKIDSLLAEKRYRLLLDFSRVDYLSSAGMRILLSASKKAKAGRGMLVIYALTDDVEEIIKMAGFDKVLRICSSEKEALQLN